MVLHIYKDMFDTLDLNIMANKFVQAREWIPIK